MRVGDVNRVVAAAAVLVLPASSAPALALPAIPSRIAAAPAFVPPSAFAAKLPLTALVPMPLPDPGVIKEQRRDGPLYTMVGTSNETRDTFPIFQARHPDGPWSRVTDALGKSVSVFSALGRPAWISTSEPDRWAPEIHAVDGQFVCVYTARHTDGDLRIAVAVAPSVRGPYHDLGPVLRAPHGVIDATIKRDRLSGQWLMVYKGDDNSVHEPTPIFSRPFSLTGNAFAWTGEPHEITRSGEGHGGLLEGPSLIDAGNTTWIALSSDFFGGPNYKMWLGTIDDLTHGTVHDLRKLVTTESPALQGRWFGPGHCALVPEAPGIISVYFHAWPGDADPRAGWSDRFGRGEQRHALRVTLAFIDEQGKPCDPYIVEDRLAR